MMKNKFLGSLLMLLFASAAFGQSTSTLTIQVYNGATCDPAPCQGMGGVQVAVMVFTPDGPDPSTVQRKTTLPDGTTSFVIFENTEYFVALSTPSYFPTVRDQMNDPGGSFFVNLNGADTKRYWMFPAPPETFYTLEVTVSTPGTLVPYQDVLLGRVFFLETGEDSAFGIGIATDTDASTFQIFNVPPAPANELGVSVSIAGKDKEVSVILESDFPHVSSLCFADMTYALPPERYEEFVSTVPASVEGYVTDQSGAPVENVRVEISSWTPSYYIFRAETFTDANGRYAFYDIPPSLGFDYNMNFNRPGYYSGGMPVSVDEDPATTEFVNFFNLKEAPYTLEGVLQYNGQPVSWAEIYVHGDGASWAGGDIYAGGNKGIQTWGMTKVNGDGTFGISGLTEGNVNLTAQFSGGHYEYKGFHEIEDQRITISSVPIGGYLPGDVIIFDNVGGTVSSGTVLFNITAGITNMAGKIFGDVTFVTTFTVKDSAPLVISSTKPVTIMAVEEWHGESQIQKMGLYTLQGTFKDATTSYSITVDSGTEYYIKVVSEDWGLLSNFERRANLSSTGTVQMSFDVAPAGRLTGTIKLPDGKNYLPPQDGNNPVDVQLRGMDVDVDEGTHVDNRSGIFEFPNIVQGTYMVRLEPRTTAFAWAPARIEGVAVRAGKTTKITITLEESLAVQPQIVGLPEIPALPSISTAAWGYVVIAVPSGRPMNQKEITDLFFEEPLYSFNYNTTAAIWETKWMNSGTYDFYLVLGTRYRPDEPGQNGDKDPQSFYQFANFIGQEKGVAIKKSESNPNLGTAGQPIPIGILGSLGQSWIGGTISGVNLIRDDDFDRIFLNFNTEIQKFIPAVMIYNTAGELKGFSNAMPDEESIGAWMTGINNHDREIIKSTMAAHPLRYLIHGLPPGKYTGVFMNPNYPPVVKEIEIPYTGKLYDFSFDDDENKTVSGDISGTVLISGTTQTIRNATVHMRHRMVERLLKTLPDGTFGVENLPPGIYRINVSMAGFAPAGDKVSLGGNGSINLTFNLIPSTFSIVGTVFTRKFPSPMTRADVRVVAYNETDNVSNPDKYLPLFETKTGPDGKYEIPAVVPSSTYTISAIYPGKNAETIHVCALTGVTTAQDIILRDAPPKIMVKVRKSPDGVYVIIKSPKELRSAPTCTYNPGRTFNEDSKVNLTLRPGPENSYEGKFAPSLTQRYYTIRVSAGEDRNKLTKDVIYDRISQARTDQFVHETSLTGGEVYMDQEKEEYSGIELDPGSLTIATGTVDYSNLVGGFFSALPSVRMVKTERGTSESVASALEGLLASEVYVLNLNNAQQNKSFTLTLRYDKEKVTNTSNLKIYQYDSTTGVWQEVPGNYTIDPMSGVVSVEVGSHQEAYQGSSGPSPMRYGASKISPQGVFVQNNSQPTQQTGQFAVFQAKPPTNTGYSGAGYEIYNMPNPFDLKQKYVDLSSDVGSSGLVDPYPTRGTLIKYHLPPAKSGHVKLLIYNLAGELVRELDETSRTGGYIYYSEWDGKNDDGNDCASGVYFLLTQVDGEKIGSKAHKMALIK